MNLKLVIGAATAAAGLTLAAASPANAVDVLFHFTNDVGNVSGTVTGEVFGLVDNATSSATKVEIFTWPAALIPPASQPFYTPPLDAVTWATQFANSFTMVGGVVTAANFHADNTTAHSTLDRLYLNSGPCSSGPTCSFLSLGSNDSQYVWHGVAGTIFGGSVPEPAAWALMLVGFAGLGVGLRGRRAQAA